MIPTRGKILAEVLSDIKQLPSGLFLADTVKDVPHYGRVIATGSPALDKRGKEIQPCASPGEIVHFKRQWLSFFEKDRIKYVFLTNDDIIGREE